VKMVFCLGCLVLCGFPVHVHAQSKDDVPALIRQLKDKDDFVRLKAAKSLGKLGVDAKDAIPALLETSTKDEDVDVRSVAKQALEKINDAVAGDARRSSFRTLEQNLLNIKSKDEITRDKAIKSLVGQLESPDEIIRAKAAQTLGDAGVAVASALSALKDAAKDQEATVRNAARKSITNINAAIETARRKKN
jgi:HEAT repeat protein